MYLGRRHLRFIATVAALASFLSLTALAWIIKTETSFSRQAEGKEPRKLQNSTDRVSYSGKLLVLIAGSM